MPAAACEPARIISHMRRSPAIVLFLALIAPMLLAFTGTGTNAATLPACCRKTGMHHCTQPSVAGGAPALVSPPCPLYPTPAVLPVLRAGALSFSAAASLDLPFSCALRVMGPEPVCRLAGRVASLRGPPTLAA